MTEHIYLKMDKTAFSVVSLSDEPDEKEYWFSKGSCQRLEALENLRRIVYGYHQSTARLQRILEITQRE